MKLPSSPFLYPILDTAFSQDLIADAEALVAAGVEILQIRAKDWSKRQIYEAAKRMPTSVRLIINDHVDVALLCSAGVHLGQADFPPHEARKILGSQSTIGISAHNDEQFAIAKEQPVDYIAIGPIYPTATKVGSPDMPLGKAFVKQVRRQTDLPIVCIGGINPDRFIDLVQAGANGIALISALYKRGDLHSAAKEMLKELKTIGGTP